MATVQTWEESRRANVERRWPRLRWDESGRSRWETWGWDRYLFVEVFCLLVSTAYLETALWNGSETQSFWPIGILAESRSGLAAVLLLIVLNGWLIDRGIADHTPGENTVPRWLRWLRRTVVSLPVLGLYGIPLWRRIAETRPSWAFQGSPPHGPDLRSPRALSTPLARFRSRFNVLRRTAGQSLPALTLFMIAGQIVPWLALLSWLTAAEIPGPGRRILLLGIAALCHVLACAFAFQYVVLRGRTIRAGCWHLAAFRCAPLLLLAPLPLFLLGLLILAVLSREEKQTLMGWSYSNRRRPPRPVSLKTSDLLPGTLENSDVKSHQFAFYRLKTFLLFFDGAALAWAFARLSGRPLFPIDDFPWLELAPFFCLAILGMLVELSFLTLHIGSWFLRRGLPYQPYGRSLAITQLVLTAGLLSGTLVATGHGETTGSLLLLIGLAGIIGLTLIFAPLSFLLKLPGTETLLIGAWALLFFELLLVGVVIYHQPELAPPFTDLFEIALALTPLWSLALFLGFRRWLLHLFDGRRTGTARAVRAAVALTAALPLGGLAVPFWIYVHHRPRPESENRP